MLLASCEGNSPVTGEFPSQRPVTRSFEVFFDLRLKKNGWVNSRDAGDSRRHRTHYDVHVMIMSIVFSIAVIIIIIIFDNNDNNDNVDMIIMI